MSTPKISPRAKPHLFEFATTCRTEDGFEFVIIAKTRGELGKVWSLLASTAFDTNKIDRVEIKRA